MYTLKITDENTVVTTVKESLIERSNYVDKLQIVTSKLYREQLDMTDADLYMRYVLPVSNKIKDIKLIPNDTEYETNYIQYLIPVDAYLTAEAGDIEVSFTFIKLIANDDETFTSYARKTTSGIIHITPLTQFSKYVPDEMLDDLDKRILALTAAEKDLNSLNKAIYDNIPNDIKLDTSDEENKKLTLINQNGNLGTGVNVKNLSSVIEGEITASDPDGVQDGVVHLDQIVDMDKLLSK